jgi:hypothetical protein
MSHTSVTNTSRLLCHYMLVPRLAPVCVCVCARALSLVPACVLVCACVHVVCVTEKICILLALAVYLPIHKRQQITYICI